MFNDRAIKQARRRAVQPPRILLTIDVEDWFQVENFKQYIPFSSWSSYELRVEKNTYQLLDIFDSANSKIENRKSKINATFFILGWIAERLPHLVREIQSRGHEVASHGYAHKMCNECSSVELEKDLVYSKKLLEDIIGDRIYGYRAPSFSINNDTLRLIGNSGYWYDSSFNSFNLNGRYGHLDLTRYKKKGIAFKIQSARLTADKNSISQTNGRQESKTLYELPISNLSIRNHVIPWGGGGYFRLFPAAIFRSGVRSILKNENVYMLYIHPWEIDTVQPRVVDAVLFYKFRHYINLNKTKSRLKRFIEDFNNCCFISCRQYLESVELSNQ